MDLDDFKGTFCGEGKYPLLNAIVNVLFKGGIPVVPATPGPEPPKPTGDKPGPEPTEEPVVPPKPEPGKCTKAGETVGVTDNCQVGRLIQEYRLIERTGPLARPFARSLAPLTRSLALDCSLRSRPPLRSLVRLLAYFGHSLARGKVNF